MIPDDHLKALGRVTIQWSALVNCLEVCLWKILGSPKHGVLVTTHMSFPQLCQAITAILNEEYPAEQSEANREFMKVVNASMKRIKKLATLRNEYLHSQWNDASSENVELAGYDKISARGKFRGEYKVATADQLEDVADDIHSARAEFWQIMFDHEIEL